MPIYAYRCESCGFQKDALQKMSDAPLTVCPSCGKDTFRKQVTAAGFQLKGSGWYVTDFRGGNNGAPAAKKDDGSKAETKSEGESSKQSGDTASKSDSSATVASNANSNSSNSTPASGSSSDSSSSKPASSTPAAPSSSSSS